MVLKVLLEEVVVFILKKMIWEKVVMMNLKKVVMLVNHLHVVLL